MIRFTPYEGTKPYIFVSYARTNLQKMMEVVSGLYEKNYRIWYDEGIPAGTDWPLYIAEHLEQSEIVLFFMSSGTLVSPNCFSEIKKAEEGGKKIICVFLDDTAEIIKNASVENRMLTLDEQRELNIKTQPFAIKRRTALGSSSLQDYCYALRHAVFIDGREEATSVYKQIVELELLDQKLIGPYKTKRRRAAGFNGWTIALVISALIFGIVLFSGYQFMNRFLEEQKEQDKETFTELETQTETEPEDLTIDPAIFGDILTDAITFPDEKQEIAIRERVHNSSDVVHFGDLKGIKKIVFCGNMTPTDTDSIRFEEGRWYVNKSAVVDGPVHDLSVIGRMYDLQELSIINQKVDDISALKDLPLLESLDISGNPIEMLELSDGFQSLNTLNISHTQIRDLKNISASKRLKKIYVSPEMLPMELDPEAEYEVILIH